MSYDVRLANLTSSIDNQNFVITRTKMCFYLIFNLSKQHNYIFSINFVLQKYTFLIK